MFPVTIYNKPSVLHTFRQEPSQDVVTYDKDLITNNIAVALADGVSEAAYSRYGAISVSKFLLEFMLKNQERCFLTAEHEFIINEIAYGINKELDILSAQYECSKVNFASTLCGVLVDPVKKNIFYCSLGDSCVFGVDAQQVRVIASYGGEKTKYTSSFGIEDIQYSLVSIDVTDALFIASDGFINEVYAHGMKKLEDNVAQIILNCDLNKLCQYLDKKLLYDDCSFCCVSLKEK